MDYTLKTFTSSELVEPNVNTELTKLLAGGLSCICPYQKSNCTSICPQFEVNTKSGALGGTEPQTTVTLHCTGRQITIGPTA